MCFWLSKVSLILGRPTQRFFSTSRFAPALGALGLSLLLSSCGPDEGALLIGSWQGLSITERGDSLRLDPREVGFTFHENARYEFRSTLKYQEAGTYRYEAGYLIANDTTQPDSPQRVVAVDILTMDSLVLRMRADTAERVLVLGRR